MAKQKTVFKVDVDGKEVELAVVRPNGKVSNEAQKVYNKAFRDAVNSESILRVHVKDILRKQGRWTEDKERQADELQKQIREFEKKIREGGIKLSEARDIAVKCRIARNTLTDVHTDIRELDNHTAEAQAEQAKFNFLTSQCVVYNQDGKPYFKDFDDYVTRSNDQVAYRAAAELALLFFGVDSDYARKNPENQFLLKYGFVDDKLRLINKDGHLVDSEGRLIDEQGFYVNAEGKRVDINGNLVDDNGDVVVDPKPFLDDEGKPVEEPK